MKNTNKNLYLLFIFLFFIFLINIFFEYINFKELKKEELYETKVQILNIYKKENSFILKLKASSFSFFTSINKDKELEKLDTLNLAFLTTNFSFYDYLKGFYTKTIYYDYYKKDESFKSKAILYINSQHESLQIKELFQALFLAIPLSKESREFFSSLGISHLIALSGFHLAVLSFILYIIFYPSYNYFHKRYFPYRNKKFDILLISIFFLFVYLFFTGLVPSLLRAFVMLVISIYLLRSNIKLFSFVNLFLVLLFICAFFPRYIFSLGLWFSIFGVFYIFLFIQYFKNIKSRVLQVLFFNFWIYFALNPIVHYFFPVSSYEQLLSPFLTIAFTIFYPLEIFLHLINYGFILDTLLLKLINMDIVTFERSTSFIFLVVYLVSSFLAIKYKIGFYILNLLMFVYIFYLFI